MNIPHSEEEKEEDFLEYLYTGWKSGVEILPQQVQMHLKLTGQERERLESGLLESGYLKKRTQNGGYRLTELGKMQGEECLLRHHNLTQFLQMTCGLEEEEAEENACRMEHVISGNVLQGVREFLKYGETYDRVVRDVDLRYLYQYGEYVSENEFKMAEFLNTLSEDEIAAMADLVVGILRDADVLHQLDVHIAQHELRQFLIPVKHADHHPIRGPRRRRDGRDADDVRTGKRGCLKVSIQRIHAHVFHHVLLEHIAGNDIAESRSDIRDLIDLIARHILISRL